jgi:hypothetical protein
MQRVWLGLMGQPCARFRSTVIRSLDEDRSNLRKCKQTKPFFASANGNRTRNSGSRPLPLNTRESFPVRVFAFLSPG